jgi:hypothetical protein
MTRRCSTCSSPLVWISRDGQHMLVCAKPSCPGHRDLFTEQERAA